MSYRLLIVYNPLSGRMRVSAPWKKLALLLPDFQCTLLDIRSEHAKLRTEIINSDSVVVIGGDGTVRTVIQTLADVRAALPLAIVPIGSGNLLARSLHLPKSIQKAARLIHEGSTTTIDIARTDAGEYCAAACAMGYLGERVAEAGKHSKRILGFGGYLWSLTRKRRLPHYQFTITVDGVIHTEEGHSVFILNASNLFGVHSRHVESMHDGYFELSVIKNKSFFSFPALIRDFYFRRGAPRHFALIRGKQFEISNDKPLSLLLDGEAFEARKTLKLQVLPNAQRIMVSRRYSNSRR